MADFVWPVRLYMRLVGARIRSQLQYRMSFILDLLATFFLSFVDFLGIAVLFAHLPHLAGWSLPQVAFFYGVANISFALCDLAAGHLDLFPEMIRTGSFDLTLIRPVGALFQVLTSDFALRRLGSLTQGAVILALALAALHVAWTPGRLAMMPVMLAGGAVIYAAVWITCCTISFWAVEAREVSNAFTYGGSFLASYPINIFGGWLRRLLAFVIPMAFVSYFPGLYVLGHADPLGAPRLLQFCTPVVALAAVLVAAQVWQFGVRHYRSTGS